MQRSRCLSPSPETIQISLGRGATNHRLTGQSASGNLGRRYLHLYECGVCAHVNVLSRSPEPEVSGYKAFWNETASVKSKPMAHRHVIRTCRNKRRVLRELAMDSVPRSNRRFFRCLRFGLDSSRLESVGKDAFRRILRRTLDDNHTDTRQPRVGNCLLARGL